MKNSNKKSRSRRFTRIADEVFVAAWCTSENLAEVAQKLRVPYRAAEGKAYRLRCVGVELPAWGTGRPPKNRGIAARIRRLDGVISGAIRSNWR